VRLGAGTSAPGQRHEALTRAIECENSGHRVAIFPRVELRGHHVIQPSLSVPVLGQYTLAADNKLNAAHKPARSLTQCGHLLYTPVGYQKVGAYGQ